MILDQMWARARPHLEAALEHARGTHEIGDLAEQIAKGNLQLWVGERCAGVTEILNFPRKRALNMFLAGGDLEEMRQIQIGIEAYARGLGCDFMMFSGRLHGRRSGWERAMPDWTPDWIAMHKELA